MEANENKTNKLINRVGYLDRRVTTNRTKKTNET